MAFSFFSYKSLKSCAYPRSLSICPVRPECTSFQNWFWPEWTCLWIRFSQLSRSGRPKCGNLESFGGKIVRAHLGPFHLSWPELVCFVRPNRKRPYIFSLCDIFTKSVFTLAMPSQRKRKHSRKINKYKCECNLTRTQEKGKFPFSCALVALASQISKREWR